MHAMEEPELIITSDGSHSLFMREMNENYHSVNGALTESKHVYLEQGYRFLGKRDNITVVEMGFGTGLNCLLTALDADITHIPTKYYAIEKYPISKKLFQSLNYPHLLGGKSGEIFSRIHATPWETVVKISPWFNLVKMNRDLLAHPLEGISEIDLVYFDAFGPDKQSGIWNTDLYADLFQRMNPGGIFVTYSAKGSVRRDLSGAGFIMERLPGAAGKREMLRGSKSK